MGTADMAMGKQKHNNSIFAKTEEERAQEEKAKKDRLDEERRQNVLKRRLIVRANFITMRELWKYARKSHSTQSLFICVGVMKSAYEKIVSNHEYTEKYIEHISAEMKNTASGKNFFSATGISEEYFTGDKLFDLGGVFIMGVDYWKNNFGKKSLVTSIITRFTAIEKEKDNENNIDIIKLLDFMRNYKPHDDKATPQKPPVDYLGEVMRILEGISDKEILRIFQQAARNGTPKDSFLNGYVNLLTEHLAKVEACKKVMQMYD